MSTNDVVSFEQPGQEVKHLRACEKKLYLDSEFKHINCAKKINKGKMTVLSEIRQFSQ